MTERPSDAPPQTRAAVSATQLLSDVTVLLNETVSHLTRVVPLSSAGNPKGDEDFVTDLDRHAHQEICTALGKLTPGIPVDSEEGTDGHLSEPTRWVLDPIDGSQNVAVGLPLAGIAVCLLYEGRVILSVLATLWPSRVLAACDGMAPSVTEAGSSGIPALMSEQRLDRVSLLRGSSRPTSEFLRVQTVLTTEFDRVYQTRCPVVDLFLLLDGGCRALVCMDLTGYETLPLLDMASRLGFAVHSASTTKNEPWNVPDRLVVARSADVEPVVETLGW
jgi:myo-inositol-1(or 4)-monophosphatase